MVLGDTKHFVLIPHLLLGAARNDMRSSLFSWALRATTKRSLVGVGNAEL